MRKQGTWMWAIVAIGLAVIVLIVGVVLYTTRDRQSFNGSSTASLGSSEQSTGQSAPSQSTQNCQPQTDCTAPQTQTQGRAVPPTQGDITAVSDSSISVRPSDGSAVKTFRITNDTRIIESDVPVAYKASELHVGQTIAVLPFTQDSTAVEYIALNLTEQFHNVDE